VTRFLVLARDPTVCAPSDTRRHKISLVFSLADGPGQLFKALSVFALRDIDLAKVESRPARDAPIAAAAAPGGGAQFGYVFYVDAVASLADAAAQNALRHLQEIAPFVRVLGCYPVDGE
jgi:arogenate/prephenate dehydratase